MMGIQRFHNWSMRNKIISISLGSIILFSLSILVFLLPAIENHMIAEKIAVTRNVVQTAMGSVIRAHALYQKGQISEEQAKQDAKDALRELRYGNKDYFWIHDNNLAHV
ncbi:MAG: cache domain-containing protein [Magnetococcales bacterium]|nr:cache domain-containing protein [Magnetococcales bacterium]